MTVLPVGIALATVMPSISSANPQPIPENPRQLQYPQRPVVLPSVENRRVVLTNGSVVYLAPDSTLPLVEISLASPVGSFLDPADQTGLAFLTGGQVRRGGAGDLDADGFDDRVDELGARIDTISGSTRSGASLSVPSWALDEGLDLLFAMLIEPTFQADRLVAARSNLLESMSRRNENALEVLHREWNWLMYGERHFSTRPLTPQSLEAIERQDLADFHRNYWRPGQMILAISGDFDREPLLSALEDRFGRWAAREPADQTPHWPPPAPSMITDGGLFHYEMDLPQAKVIVGHRFPTLLDWGSPDRFTIEVVAELLGGRGASSRIAGRLRTAEGLVYRASAILDPGDLWAGELQIFFDTKNSSVARAVELVIEEVERIRTEPAHPRELEVVKQSLLAQLRLRFDTAEEVAGYFAEDELLGRPHEYWHAYIESVLQVSVADVQRAAATYLRPPVFSFLVVGPWREISAGAPPGASALEKVTGYRMTPLAARDPLTLESQPANKKGVEPDADRRHGRFPR